MQEHNLFHDYLDKVCEQIRWKKAHSVVSRELGDHLEDEQSLLIESGLLEDEAANKAVLDMGDATLVGSQLDRAYRPRPAWGIICIVAALMAVGFFARMYIVQHPDASYQHVDRLFIINNSNSPLWLCAAIVIMIMGYFLDYTILGKHPLIIGAGFVVMMVLIRYTSRMDIFGMPYNIYYYGAYLVVLIPVVYASILWWWPYKGYSGLISAYLTLITLTLMVLKFSIIFHALIYGAIGGILLTAELLKGRFNVKKSRGMLILYGPVVAGIIWLCNISSIGNRLLIAFRPELDLGGRGFLGFHIRKILTNAKWIGVSEYTGEYPVYYLPDMVNNYMLTFYINQFGWMALGIVLLFFILLIAFSAVLMAKQKSRLGRMISLAILLSLAVQSSLYILNNLGMALGSFTTLPLLSYGNAALLVDSFLIGLMLSVFRNDDVVRDPIIAPKRIPRIRITMERLP